MMAAEDNSTFDQAAGATVIVGLGKTGLSCARYLTQRGETFVVVDSRSNPPGLKQLLSVAPNVQCYLGGFEPLVFDQAQRLIVSPGVSVKESVIANARAHGAEVLGDIALFAAHADAPIIAITGSNGKSTVTTLLGAMAEHAELKVKVGGNLGEPALNLLPGKTESELSLDKTDYYILELSSFQLETTDNLKAYAAVVLNISADHMDRYVNVQEYVDAKKNIYLDCQNKVINRDDELVAGMTSSNKTEVSENVVSFGMGMPPTTKDFGIESRGDKAWLVKGSQLLMRVDEIGLPGRHNQANALAALALGEVTGIDVDDMLHVLRHFSGLPHRMQLVAKIREIDWYNDSKGTNVGATVSALAGMPGNKILIAGGDGKGADFNPLREAVIANNVRVVILIGKDAECIESVLSGVVQIERAENMTAAVVLADKLAKAKDKVILSPACASFDMFSDYQHRGEVFMESVRSLPS
jgi:UDP-N-acetylmuramoylalanine--D-glutamate ligase